MNILQTGFVPFLWGTPLGGEHLANFECFNPVSLHPFPPIQLLADLATPAQTSNKLSLVSGPPRGPLPTNSIRSLNRKPFTYTSRHRPRTSFIHTVPGRKQRQLCPRRQWCTTPEQEYRVPDDECTLDIDEEAFTTRLQLFQTFIDSPRSAVRRDATTLAFEQIFFIAEIEFLRKNSNGTTLRRHCVSLLARLLRKTAQNSRSCDALRSGGHGFV